MEVFVSSMACNNCVLWLSVRWRHCSRRGCCEGTGLDAFGIHLWRCRKDLWGRCQVSYLDLHAHIYIIRPIFFYSVWKDLRVNHFFTVEDVAKGHFLFHPLEAARIARWPCTMVFASSPGGVGSTCRDGPNRHGPKRCVWHIPAFGYWHWQHLPKWHLVQKVTWNDMEEAMPWEDFEGNLPGSQATMSINFWVVRRSNLSPRWSWDLM